MIKPLDRAKPAIIIEFKHLKHGGSLKKMALEGLQQIKEKQYIHILRNEGYAKIMAYSIAFYKKNCAVVMETIVIAINK